MSAPRSSLRDLPSVAYLLEQLPALGFLEAYPRPQVVEALRDATRDLRERLRAGLPVPPREAWVGSLCLAAQQWLQRRAGPSLRTVVNATGVVLHTNLGRAILPEPAVRAVERAAASYTNLELDLAAGERGDRSSHVDRLLCELTGAEAACVVNNNAASMLLLLDELARGGEVIVARSELIEIGGSFRLPDVLERSGARLVEVGTTNRCYVADYARAVSPQTSLLLKSHPSNYRIIGFTHEVTLDELAALGAERGIPTAMDLGCGVLVDLSRWDLPAEPTARQCVESGTDVVCFSGDKLLGGPQAGILVGRAAAISRLKRNPLMRALRCDKMTLAALEATLQLYRDPERLPEAVPVLEMLTRSQPRLEAAARELAGRLAELLPFPVRACPSQGLPGGGTLPALELPTWVVSIDCSQGGDAAWARALRQAPVPVLARVERGCVLLDARTLMAGDLDLVIASCRAALQAVQGSGGAA